MAAPYSDYFILTGDEIPVELLPRETVYLDFAVGDDDEEVYFVGKTLFVEQP